MGESTIINIIKFIVIPAELVKGERGLGFSILDYQDPLRPAHAVIVIRSLVPGGVAQQDGRLIPGDRLLTVNDQVSYLPFK